MVERTTPGSEPETDPAYGAKNRDLNLGVFALAVSYWGSISPCHLKNNLKTIKYSLVCSADIVNIYVYGIEMNA